MTLYEELYEKIYCSIREDGQKDFAQIDGKENIGWKASHPYLSSWLLQDEYGYSNVLKLAQGKWELRCIDEKHWWFVHR